ncbi:hypothetical protein GCM10027416_32960 [Okibacterium endophyticum]
MTGIEDTTAPPSFDEFLAGAGEVPSDEKDVYGRQARPDRRLVVVASLSALVIASAIAVLVVVFAMAPVVGPVTTGTATTDGSPEPAPSEEAPEVTAEPDADGAAPEDAGGITALPDPSWLAATARRTSIPQRALAAYAGAAIQMAEKRPGCGLGWNTLAAIGFVETDHGAIHGGVVAEDGTVSPPVLGLVLDGSETLAVPDTDAGALDGDPVWDRALGPMQFIPSTWSEWKTDGNGDGISDVHNLDDAVLSAAHYLCAAGTDLRRSQGWIDAVMAYNPAAGYNNRVAESASAYAASAARGDG